MLNCVFDNFILIILKNLNKYLLFFQKNKNSISEFAINDLREDVIDEIVEDLQALKVIVKQLATIDMDKELNEINYQYVFRSNLVKLIGIYGHLSTEFEDLYNFHSDFIKSLPEGPQDDSELVK